MAESEKAADNSDQGHLIYGFFRDIAIIEQLSRTRVERALPKDMKQSHFAVLSHLVRSEHTPTPADLASAMQVTRASMTNTLQKLESKNYIRLAPDPNDGRGKRVQLTDLGRDAQTQAIQAIGPLFQDIVEAVGPDFFEQAYPLTSQLREYMDTHR